MRNKRILLGMLALLLSACSENQTETLTPNQSTDKRWYTIEQVSAGAELFQANCAACHGKQAEGSANWQKPGADGKYPAPPLNGTGHGWHHPLAILYQLIKYGSPGGQGNMPAWGEKLSDDEIIAAIAWFQSHWSREIYQNWANRDAASRKQ